MPMSQAMTNSTLELTPLKEAELDLTLPTSSTTAVSVPDNVRRTIWAASLAHLGEDIHIALEVERRDARDSGARILLDDFLREQGFDPHDF
jgi:hypothetical protein